MGGAARKNSHTDTSVGGGVRSVVGIIKNRKERLRAIHSSGAGRGGRRTGGEKRSKTVRKISWGGGALEGWKGKGGGQGLGDAQGTSQCGWHDVASVS